MKLTASVYNPTTEEVEIFRKLGEELSNAFDMLVTVEIQICWQAPEHRMEKK